MRRVEKETRETKRKRERDAKNTRRGIYIYGVQVGYRWGTLGNFR